MITFYRVQNFKGLNDVAINFDLINVLIGPNTSGKTSILESIEFLQAFLEPSVDLYLKQQGIDLSDVRNKYNRKKIIAYDVIFDIPSNQNGQYGGKYHYMIEYNTESNRINKEQLTYLPDNQNLINHSSNILLKRDMKSFYFHSFMGDDYKGDYLIPSAGTLAFITEEDSDKFPEISYFKKHFANMWSFFVWDPKLFRKASRGEGGLGRYGERLASTLFQIKKKDEHIFEKVIKTVKKNLPLDEITELIRGRDEFILAVAIPEIESWFLADTPNVLKWLDLPQRKISEFPCLCSPDSFEFEKEQDPKKLLNDMLQDSRSEYDTWGQAAAEEFIEERWAGEGLLDYYSSRAWTGRASLDLIANRCSQGFRPFRYNLWSKFSR